MEECLHAVNAFGDRQITWEGHRQSLGKGAPLCPCARSMRASASDTTFLAEFQGAVRLSDCALVRAQAQGTPRPKRFRP
eukprot:5373037-Pyramimonas_sp.AAC.1